MSVEHLAALSLFCLVSSVTPGPNNLMLMASGANYGFRATVPHILGIGLGFAFMVVLVGLGLIGIFEAFPQSYLILQIVSVVYLSWLAWKIATSVAPKSVSATGKPLSFLQAAAFQWVNPKAWTISLSIITLYAWDQTIFTITLIGFVSWIVGLPSVCLWTILGQKMQLVLTSHLRLRLFNGLMALLLIASLIPVLWH